MEESHCKEVACEVLDELEAQAANGRGGPTATELIKLQYPDISDEDLWQVLDNIRNEAHNRAHLLRTQKAPTGDLRPIFDRVTAERNSVEIPATA
jgi:hypothetical protein